MEALRNLGRSTSGNAAIEFAIIAMLLIVVCVSVVEFGRGLKLRSELSSVGDRAARIILNDPEVSNELLETSVRDAFAGPQPELLEVSFGTETADGIEFRTVVLRHPLTLLIPGLGKTINLTLFRRIPVG